MKRKMKASHRNFFESVAQAVYVNPMSQLREPLYQKIAGEQQVGSDKELFEAVMRSVSSHIAIYDDPQLARLSDFDDADVPLMRYVYLFECYNTFIYQFDELIEKENKLGECQQVTFAGDLIKRLKQRGFQPDEISFCISMFYQIRRAFYFIERSLIGQSPCMQKLRMDLWNNIFTFDIRYYEKFLWNRMEDFSTLLLGPTGSGKGAAAAAIGRSGYIPFDDKKKCFSECFKHNFVPINLSEFPASLIESELFGHKKGAFTGAIEAHDGVFAKCSEHGSIFLDEIGEITEQIQIKLLRVLEERQYSPVGSFDKRRFNGRVIAATHQSVDQLREDGHFRDDFFYRLCSDVIVMPSLHQRLEQCPEEMNDLLSLTIERIVGHKNDDLLELVSQAIQKNIPENYTWPGNVRELAQCVRRILLKKEYEGDQVKTSNDLTGDLQQGIQAGDLTAQSLMEGYCRLLYDRCGNIQEVARRTGLDRRTVKKYLPSS